MKTFILLLSGLSSIMTVLKTVETNNDSTAIGDDGKAYGILQIHRGVVRDVNRIYDKDYSHEDMFDDSVSEEVFRMYICYGKELFLKKHCKFPNEEEIVRMWNGGIYKGYKYNDTKKYYRKYLLIKKELLNEETR